MSEKLTNAQRMLLQEAARDSFKDGSGRGRIMFDGREARVASNLAAKGLVTLPAGHGWVFNSFGGVRITLAGRAALASTRKEP